jgi:hypothetical protein
MKAYLLDSTPLYQALDRSISNGKQDGVGAIPGPANTMQDVKSEGKILDVTR